MNKNIYLDNNATTFVDARVASAICNYLKQSVGNPSSVHFFGREARRLLQASRRDIADVLGVKPQELVFTSGATEGLNMVIRGMLELMPKGHIISSSVEHPAVYACLEYMQQAGWEVSFLPPGMWGAITPSQVEEAIRPDTKLIVLMAANNETGVMTDIRGIAAIAACANIPFVADGVALLGKERLIIPEGVSAMCFSGHKIHAPSGTGFCFIRQGIKMHPLLIGGEQEFQRRGGTENLPGIIGLAEAMRILKVELSVTSDRMRQLRDKLEAGILEKVPGTKVNGEGPRVSNTSNVAFVGKDGEGLLASLDIAGVAVSHGSACSSGALEPSRVLLNMGLPRSVARSSLRISLSRFTTEEEVDEALNIIAEVASKAL
jgi:cysteine desulfurase